MNLLVTAGGTGGHIYPALAIIEEFRKRDKNLQVIYIGTHNRMEKDIIPQNNIKYIPIEIYGLTKNVFHDIKNLYLIGKAKKKCLDVIEEFKPDIVIAAGGYVTYPVIMAARKKNIPIFIHEQNAIPGKVNRLTAKYASLIGVSFKETIKYLPKDKTIYTGNPTGNKALETPSISKETLGFKSDKKLVVIVMGSLGSMTINKAIQQFLLEANSLDYQILYISGKNYYETLKNNKYPKNVKVLPYLNNLAGLFKNTDLLITRAGASTMAEIISLKVVSVFVPSPYVANNHQLYNALGLVNKGCAKLLEEKDFNAFSLTKVIKETLENTQEYEGIVDNLKKQETPPSTKIIYEKISELIKSE